MVRIVNPPKGSHFQIGDFVPKAGIYTRPGVIIEKKDNGMVVIDTNKEEIDKYHRHTNTSGLSPDEKKKFNEIMDKTMEAQSNGERINQLQVTIDNLKLNVEDKKVVEYLRNEQAQLIRLSRELPRIYTYESGRIR